MDDALAQAAALPECVYSDEWCVLLQARWEDVIERLPRVDAVITDPPFGERTHEGQRHGRHPYPDAKSGCTLAGRKLGYESWSDDQVRQLIEETVPRIAGWFCALTSHDLVPVYSSWLQAHKRYVYAPISCVQFNRNVRLAGDGPSNWTDHLVASRPRTLAKWGALPGAYVGRPFDGGENMLDRSKRVTGGKPVWLMRDLVRDYSRPGDLILDPCAGGATTLVAARLEGRRAIGIEMDVNTAEKARKRLAAPWTPMFRPGSLTGTQEGFDL